MSLTLMRFFMDKDLLVLCVLFLCIESNSRMITGLNCLVLNAFNCF